MPDVPRSFDLRIGGTTLALVALGAIARMEEVTHLRQYPRNLIPTVRLLTIQSNTARLGLMRNGIHRASWSCVANDPDWIALYRKMVVTMRRQGLSTAGRPPIWAWPCSASLGGPMTLDVALFFLGGIEKARRAWVIEFDAPMHLSILSRYRAWQEIVYCDKEGRPNSLGEIFDRRSARKGTLVHADARCEPDAYQVCLPMLL